MQHRLLRAIAVIVVILVGLAAVLFRADENVLGKFAHFDLPIRSPSIDVAVADAKAAGAPVGIATLSDGSVRLYPTVHDRDDWTYALATADPQRGETIARKGTAAGAPACATCHGGLPETQRQTENPVIAGLDLRYLAAQLDHYKSGARASDTMAPIASALTGQERADAAAWAAGLRRPAPTQSDADTADAKLVALGATLDSGGNDSRRIPSCGACHGGAGAGGIPRFPALSGQDRAYLVTRLKAMRDSKDTTRLDGGAATMHAIAQRLTDDDINAAAAFYASDPAGKP